MKEQSYRAGGGCGRGCPSPSHGRDFFFYVCIKTAFFAIIRGRFCNEWHRPIPYFLLPLLVKLSNQIGMGEWSFVSPLATPVMVCSQDLSTGDGGQNGNFCTLNAIIRCRLCKWHRPIPYSSFFNSSINRGHGPAPLCPPPPLATPVNNMQFRGLGEEGEGRRACMRIM